MEQAQPRSDEAVAPCWWGCDRARAVGAALLILGITLAAYAPALRAGYIWDDDDYVTQNQTLKTADGLGRIWFEPRSIPQYYPLVHTTFWLEYRLWGLHATGYHVTNILLHAVAAVLLWRVLRVLELPGALAAACLFALHPVHVESVAWITERKNVLSLVFTLAALLAYLKGCENRRVHFAALALFVCAMLSKTVACSLPAAIALILWWKRGVVARRDWVRLAPMFAIGLAMGLMTVWLEKTHVGAEGQDWSLSAVERVLIAGRAVWFYAGKLLWPASLTFIYPRWTIDASAVSQYTFPAAAIALVAALWCVRGRLGRGPLVAVLLFGGTLLPALGFIDVYPMRYSFVADHFQYAASIALIVLIVAAAARVLDERRLAAAACVVAVGLGMLTWRQSRVYHGPQSLWEDVLAKNPDCWMAENNLAAHLVSSRDYAGAERHARRAIAIKADHAEAFNTLGLICARTGRFKDAEANYAAALRLTPTLAKAHVNWGVLLARGGRIDEAATHFAIAVELRPRNLEALYNLATASAELGRLDAAERWYRRTLDLAPAHAQAREGLDEVLAVMQQQAVRDAQVGADPRDALPLPPTR